MNADSIRRRRLGYSLNIFHDIEPQEDFEIYSLILCIYKINKNQINYLILKLYLFKIYY